VRKTAETLQTDRSTPAEEREIFYSQAAAEEREEKEREEKEREEKDKEEKDRQEKKQEERPVSSVSNVSSSENKHVSLGYAESAHALYQKLCPGLVPCPVISDQLRSQLLSLKGSGITLDNLEEVFRLAQDTPFLRGESPRGWKASLEWLTVADNLRRVQSGVYAPRKEKVPLGCSGLGAAEMEALQKLLGA